MPNTHRLISTKLRPPFIRRELVPRPRLQARIAEGLRRPLTLVAANAGFGKTTLVAAALADCGMPVAWLSLDRDDNQPGRFLRYLVAALHAAAPAVGQEIAQAMAAGQQAPPEVILTGLINDLDTTGQEMALVLDDYHVLSNPAVHAQVIFLLEHGPGTFHLIIATRSDPPLPLTRLRARGQAVELRTADLSFTEAEAAQFLNDVMGLRLDAGSVAALEARTEGWIAGLQMAALSMQGRADANSFVRGFTGTHRFILDYLLEEVLAREPEEVQRFLLQTAVLTRLSGPLCDAVTGAAGSQAMLERLEQRNLFVVPLDDERHWYRYHHLFADLLQARLQQSEPGLVGELRTRAAAWCEQDGQVNEAVGYALAAQDFARAAELIERYWWHLTNNGEVETVGSWLEALPDATLKTSAALSTICCWVLWLMGQVGAIAAHLSDAERAWDAAPERERAGEGGATLPVEHAILRALVARYHDDPEAAGAHAERARRLLPEGAAPEVSAQLRALVFLALATAYDGLGDLEQAAAAYTEAIHWGRVVNSATGVALTYRLLGPLQLLGRLRAAEAACRDALRYVTAQGMARLPAAGILHVALSEVLVEQNHLDAAAAHLARGFELGKWSGRLDAVKNAAGALARLRQARHDPEGALAAIAEAAAATGDPPPPLAHAELLALKARVLVRQGRLDEAAACAAQAARLAGRDRGQTGARAALATSRVVAARSSPGDAVAQLTSSLSAAEAAGRWGAALELRILRSLARARGGDAQGAQADLEAALALAAPEGYVRIFLDEGPPMQSLLALWLAHAAAGPLRDYAAHLLAHVAAELPEAAAASQPAEPGQRAAPVEALSPREREVLHLMALGRTNKEIAGRLFVAPGTVKAHTSSIYRKLDVANRTEAVARARELGLLP